MSARRMDEDDRLEDFEARTNTLLDNAKVVHVAGSGPAVIVMTEMPGISPQVARFSRWVREAGFTGYLPSLFGRDGAVASAEEPPTELAAVRQRLEAEDLSVLAYRFAGDRFCRAERFAAYAEALGARFVARVLPDSAANPSGLPPFFEQNTKPNRVPI